jgi:hypothetical protein
VLADEALRRVRDLYTTVTDEVRLRTPSLPFIATPTSPQHPWVGLRKIGTDGARDACADHRRGRERINRPDDCAIAEDGSHIRSPAH